MGEGYISRKSCKTYKQTQNLCPPLQCSKPASGPDWTLWWADSVWQRSLNTNKNSHRQIIIIESTAKSDKRCLQRLPKMAQDKVSKSFFPRNYICSYRIPTQISVQFLSCDVSAKTKLKWKQKTKTNNKNSVSRKLHIKSKPRLCQTQFCFFKLHRARKEKQKTVRKGSVHNGPQTCLTWLSWLAKIYCDEQKRW